MIQLETALIPKMPFFVAMSGGVDSLAGIDLLSRLNADRVSIYHYNHKTRPQNDEMEKVVRKYADDRGIPIQVDSRKEGRPTTEAAMREDRMDAIRKLNAPIVLCHHLDDAVEGYILNMLKGCPEYCPIPMVTPLERSFGYIVRPFLRTRKEDFEEYVHFNALTRYLCVDETNTDSTYSRRNLIRNEVLPKFDGMGLPKVVLKKFYL